MLWLAYVVLTLLVLTVAALHDQRPARRVKGLEFEVEHDDVQERPLVLLLHADDSDPEEAYAAIADIPGIDRARVVMPLAPHVVQRGRSWVHPRLYGAAAYQALHEVGEQVGELLQVMLTRYPTRPRVFVVGLGSGGVLATQVALSTSSVQEAFAFGGALPTSAIPAATDAPSAPVHKQSWGPAVGADRRAQQLAVARGFEVLLHTPDGAEHMGHLWPELPTLPQPTPIDHELAAQWLAPRLTAALNPVALENA